jgi:hypothetical protein
MKLKSLRRNLRNVRSIDAFKRVSSSAVLPLAAFQEPLSRSPMGREAKYGDRIPIRHRDLEAVTGRTPVVRA